jgi:cysteine desulfurase
VTAIYLDHNATTRIAPEALEAMAGVLRAGLGNPSSPHGSGRRARRLLEDAREEILELVGASSGDRLIFTSGGTEANNLAVRGLGAENQGILVSSIEHPSVLEPARQQAAAGRRVGYLPADLQGTLRIDLLEMMLDGVGLVSAMAANNETGARQPIAQVARICRSRGVVCHTDAVQAVGKTRARFTELGVDAMTISAHKLHGPPGIGALVCRRGLPVRPLLSGGSQQERIRPGTESVPLAVGMCAALRSWMQRQDEHIAHLRELRDRFEARLLASDPTIVVHAAGAERLANTSNLAFPGIDRQALLMAADLEGLECSTGSACASGAPQTSSVLAAMGVPETLRASSLRFSFGISQGVAEVEMAAERILRIIKQLRSKVPPRSMAGTISRSDL